MIEQERPATINRAADRVREWPYVVARCPVCREEIYGTLTVGIYLGEMTVDPGDNNQPEAAVEVETKMRRLRVVHDCTPDSGNVATPASDQEQ